MPTGDMNSRSGSDSEEFYAATSDVQFGQRDAAFGIDSVHRGHDFMLSGGGTGFADSLLTIRTIMNTQSAMMRKVTTELMNIP